MASKRAAPDSSSGSSSYNLFESEELARPLEDQTDLFSPASLNQNETHAFLGGTDANGLTTVSTQVAQPSSRESVSSPPLPAAEMPPMLQLHETGFTKDSSVRYKGEVMTVRKLRSC